MLKTISEFKNLLRQMRKEVLAKSNEIECDSLYYYDIYLESVEEDIALWRKENTAHKDYCYLYTNLEGELLFSGKTFKYATPFSNSRACVNNYREWFILDLEKKEIIVFPSELIFDNINTFRNDSLPIFNQESFSWGSVRYNPTEESFEKDIPFIWNVLEFSRLEDQVYVGMRDIPLVRNNHPYCGDDIGNMFTINAMKLPILKAKNLSYYNNQKNEYIDKIDQDVISYIQEEVSKDISREKRREIIEEYLKTAYNISDYYFEEDYKEETNNNESKIVDVGIINEYQRKFGKWIK